MTVVIKFYCSSYLSLLTWEILAIFLQSIFIICIYVYCTATSKLIYLYKEEMHRDGDGSGGREIIVTC